ncbi:Heme-degrading monooxygenase IsdG [Geobacillus sp. B4113_201601]|nr:Heme-degrading monooxygenase IsdG [Geobacillus sp. B4113_201601]
MYLVANEIRVKKGFASQLVKRFEERKGIEKAPGFVRLDILVNEQPNNYDEVRVCTMWETKDAFIGWTKSEAFRKAHDQRGKAPLDYVLGNQMYAYEVALTFGG